MSRDVAPCLAPCKKFYPSHVFTRLPSPSPFRNDASAAEMLGKVAVETRSGKRGDMARIVMKFGGTSMAGTERIRTVARSEEHTSELPSLMRISYAGLCLKKKKTTKT